MASLTAGVAEAVKDALDAEEGFSEAFTPVRRWNVRYALTELTTLKVTVVPGPLSIEEYDRGADDERRFVDIAVQKHVGVDSSGNPNDSDVDPLVVLLEEFIVFFRGKSLTVPTRTAVCVNRGMINPSEAPVAKEHLDDLETFTGVLRLEFRMRD